MNILVALIFLITSSIYAVPCVIAHRGGGHNFPENTLLAFAKSLEMGCEALELDVQVTKDGVVVVYHPEDLKQLTNGSGRISNHLWEEIADLNAGYHFKPEEGYPFRNLNLKIPKLEDVLCTFPQTLLIIDMKSLPAEPLVRALINTISDKESARLIFYSTNSEHLALLSQLKPLWRIFDQRDRTCQRLLELNQTGRSELPLTSNWVGFELKRKMAVTETFALGQGTSTVEFHLWHPETISYLKMLNPNVFLILFGINKKEEWEAALSLGVDAIYTDNPTAIFKFKADSQCFLVKKGNEIIVQEGACERRSSPRSTFKIAISLMAFDGGLLAHETEPEFPFLEGYADYNSNWKQPHHPTLWMKNSCLWVSQVLTQQLGMDKFSDYVTKFNYGNRDVSGGLTEAWLSSSLVISPEEQTLFLQKLVDNRLPVSLKAHQMTKNILFLEELPGGWKLYGKTGSGLLTQDMQFGWFVGWLQKENQTVVFAHYLEDAVAQETYAGPRARDMTKVKLMKMIEEGAFLDYR